MSKKIRLKVHFAHAKTVSNEEVELTLVDMNKGIASCSKPPVFFKFSQEGIVGLFTCTMNREDRSYGGRTVSTEDQFMEYDLYSGAAVYFTQSQITTYRDGSSNYNNIAKGYKYHSKYGYHFHTAAHWIAFDKDISTDNMPTLSPQHMGYKIENPPALVEHLAKGRCSVTNLAKGEMILKTSVFDQGYVVQLAPELLLLMTKAAEALLEGHPFEPLPENLIEHPLVEPEIAAVSLAGASDAAAASTDAPIVE